jgi:hypothetical protein
MTRTAWSAARWLVIVGAVLAPAPAALHAQAEDDLGSIDDEETSAPESVPEGEADSSAAAAPAQQDEEQAPEVSAEEQAPVGDTPSDLVRIPPQRALGFYAGAGLGVGSLEFERPTAQGVQKLPQTPFAAAELLLRGRAWPHNHFSLELALAYQTSLGLVLQVAPLFALPQNIDARWQRVELDVAPIVRLGESANAPQLAFPLGFAIASLFPGVHQFSVPKYDLGGPQLRAELLLHLGEFVSLRVGPEAQWLVVIGSALRSEGACCQGVAIGGRAALDASVGPTIRLGLAYSESHAFVPVGSWRFMDVERFLTARIAGAL